MKYEWILFDADETLFHFDAFRGLELVFSHNDVSFTKQDFETYQTLNKSLWVKYQNGEITAEALKHQRFDTWSLKLGLTAEELNKVFMTAMVQLCTPLDGAVNLIHALSGKAKLGIITNGFIELQEARLERTGLKNHFDLLVISEQVGVAKPHRAIFDYAHDQMGKPDREQVLMVGDTLESDILGGMNAGYDTCWLNITNKPAMINIKPKYQISSLNELQMLLLS